MVAELSVCSGATPADYMLKKLPQFSPRTAQTDFPEGKAYLPETAGPSVRYVTPIPNKHPRVRVIMLPEPLDFEGTIERLEKHFIESEATDER